jgi:hypothetical protein
VQIAVTGKLHDHAQWVVANAVQPDHVFVLQATVFQAMPRFTVSTTSTYIAIQQVHTS